MKKSGCRQAVVKSGLTKKLIIIIIIINTFY